MLLVLISACCALLMFPGGKTRSFSLGSKKPCCSDCAAGKPCPTDVAALLNGQIDGDTFDRRNAETAIKAEMYRQGRGYVLPSNPLQGDKLNDCVREYRDFWCDGNKDHCEDEAIVKCCKEHGCK